MSVLPWLAGACMRHGVPGFRVWNLTRCPCAQSWQTTKNALISCAVYVPVAVTMISIAWSSKRHKERNLHGGIPVLVSGVAFLCAPPARLPILHQNTETETN